MIKAVNILERLPKRTRNAAGCMIIAGDKTLLLQRSASSYNEPLTWCIPGGRMDTNESPWDTAVRETFEEANINLSQYTPEGKRESLTPGDKNNFTTYIFRFRPEAITQFPVHIDSESNNWGWFTRNEVENLNLHPGFEQVMNTVNF